MRRTLKLNDQIKQLAADLKDEQSCLMFGRGRNYATAMEAALKVGPAKTAGVGAVEHRRQAFECITLLRRPSRFHSGACNARRPALLPLWAPWCCR